VGARIVDDVIVVERTVHHRASNFKRHKDTARHQTHLLRADHPVARQPLRTPQPPPAEVFRRVNAGTDKLGTSRPQIDALHLSPRNVADGISSNSILYWTAKRPNSQNP
jgi:hypothetical protein